MEYYGNNDWRDYHLAHYGKKGMKWHKHLPGINKEEKTQRPNAFEQLSDHYRQGAKIRRKLARVELTAAARAKTGKQKLDHENKAHNLNAGVSNTTHWAKKYEHRAELSRKRKSKNGFLTWVKNRTGSKAGYATRILPRRKIKAS